MSKVRSWLHEAVGESWLYEAVGEHWLYETVGEGGYMKICVDRDKNCG
jgi:hypothetical protein